MKTTADIRKRRLAFVYAALGLACASLIALTPAFTASAPAPLTSVHEEEDEELDGRAPTPIELQPGVEAAFPRESYRPRSNASLVIFDRARGFRLQIFRAGSEHTVTHGYNEMRGVPVTEVRQIGRSTGQRVVPIRIGDWTSGLYFARLTATDGRIGFAPFVLGPGRLGEHRIAVVMPTLTWQAYNLRDDDGDGKGDSWYANWSTHTVRLGRPFLNRGVPYNFRRYDLPFLRWLARSGRNVDLLADADLDSARTGDELAAAYDLVVFPGHHEYVTTHEYDVIQRYRDLGGNLMFLSANNFFWRVVKHGNVIEKTSQWRDLGRAESALIGVQYRGNDRGTHRGSWILTHAPATSWLFAGTGLRAGEAFGNGGIEIDKTASTSPAGVQVLAEIPNLFGAGFTAQMTYYETPNSARVFAAGAFTLAGAALDPQVSKVLGNLWQHLADDGRD